MPTSAYPQVRVHRAATALVMATLLAAAGCGGCGVGLRRGVGGGSPPGPLGDELRVDPNGEKLGRASNAGSVIRNPDGSFVVVWVRNQSYFEEVYGQRFGAGGDKTGEPFLVSQEGYGLTYPASSAIARHESGSFVVVWSGHVADGYADILARRFSVAGVPQGDQFVVNTYTTGRQYNPSVTATGNGEFVVVWTTTHTKEGSDYDLELYGRRFGSDGTPNADDFHVNTFTTTTQNHARIDSRGDGSFVVVWDSGGLDSYSAFDGPDGAYLAVSARRFDDDGDAIGNEFVVNTFTTYSEWYPDVAVKSDGSFVVVWETQYGNEFPGGPYGTILSHSVTMRRYDGDGDPLGDEEHINVIEEGNQGRPAVAMDSNGGYVVVWESADTYNTLDLRDHLTGIFGRAFDGSGQAEGGDFHVNTYTTSVQKDASVATDGNGGFVIVWNGTASYSGQYGFDYINGVGARLFQKGAGGAPLLVTKDDDGHVWDDDNQIVYTIAVTNNDEEARDVVLTETVPRRASFASAGSTAGWGCSPDNDARSTCTLSLGTLQPDQTKEALFAVTMKQGTTPLWTTYNRVLATSGEQTVSAQEATPHGFCNALNLDPEFCSAICYFAAEFCVEGGGATAGSAAGSGGGEPNYEFLQIRDEILAESRGGDRLVDLYYDLSEDIVDATETDPSLIPLGAGLIATLSNAGMANVTQEQVNAVDGFFTSLRSAAGPELAEVLDRELPRLDLDSYVGSNTMDLLDGLDDLTCEGFETGLLCGDMNGDCVIQAADALSVLRVAVKIDPEKAEADVDGNGAINAADALAALRIAVKIDPIRTGCGVV